MTQTKEQSAKVLEFKKLFPTLDEEGQEKMLSILRTLEFAQSVALSAGNSGHRTVKSMM